MEYEQEQQWVAEIKKYVAENLVLSKIGDEELTARSVALACWTISWQMIRSRKL